MSAGAQLLTLASLADKVAHKLTVTSNKDPEAKLPNCLSFMLVTTFSKCDLYSPYVLSSFNK